MTVCSKPLTDYMWEKTTKWSPSSSVGCVYSAYFASFVSEIVLVLGQSEHSTFLSDRTSAAHPYESSQYNFTRSRYSRRRLFTTTTAPIEVIELSTATTELADAENDESTEGYISSSSSTVNYDEAAKTEYVTEPVTTERPQITSASSTTEYPQIPHCGLTSNENFPWIAVLEHTNPYDAANTKQKTLSKGVLISPQHVLTTVSSIFNSHPFWTVWVVKALSHSFPFRIFILLFFCVFKEQKCASATSQHGAMSSYPTINRMWSPWMLNKFSSTIVKTLRLLSYSNRLPCPNWLCQSVCPLTTTTISGSWMRTCVCARPTGQTRALFRCRCRHCCRKIVTYCWSGRKPAIHRSCFVHGTRWVTHAPVIWAARWRQRPMDASRLSAWIRLPAQRYSRCGWTEDGGMKHFSIFSLWTFSEWVRYWWCSGHLYPCRCSPALDPDGY